MQCFNRFCRIYKQKTTRIMKEIDIHLIQELRKQNSKAQQMTLERFGNAVFAQVARLIPGLENAEEVYQDVFMKGFKNIKM